MVHGLLSRIQPVLPTTEEIGAASIGSLLGSFSQLYDLGFQQGPTDSTTIRDTIRTDVSRKPRRTPRQKPREQPKPKPRDPIDTLLVPSKPSNPSYYSPLYASSISGEALRARDSLDVKVKRGQKTEQINQYRTYDLTTDTHGRGFIRVTTSKGRYRYLDRSGKKIPACHFLESYVEGRSHKKTGKKDARLRQIRRTYAHYNCR